MNKDKISKLLELYFAGNTSLAEENELIRFFSKKNIPAKLEQYRHLFVYFKQEKQKLSHPFFIKKRFTFTILASAVAACFAVIVIFKTTDLSKAKQDYQYFYYINGQEVKDPKAATQHVIQQLSTMSSDLQENNNKTLANLF